MISKMIFIAFLIKYLTAAEETYRESRTGLYTTAAGLAPNGQNVRIDIAGMFLGTLIGLGTILILPKMLHLLTPYAINTHSNIYGRKIDESFLEMIQEAGHLFTNSTLLETQCPYKLVCTYLHTTKDTINRVFDMGHLMGLKKDTVLDYIPGQNLKEAIELGLSNSSTCNRYYNTCPISTDQMEEFTKMLISKFF